MDWAKSSRAGTSKSARVLAVNRGIYGLAVTTSVALVTALVGCGGSETTSDPPAHRAAYIDAYACAVAAKALGRRVNTGELSALPYQPVHAAAGRLRAIEAENKTGRPVWVLAAQACAQAIEPPARRLEQIREKTREVEQQTREMNRQQEIIEAKSCEIAKANLAKANTPHEISVAAAEVAGTPGC